MTSWSSFLRRARSARALVLVLAALLLGGAQIAGAANVVVLGSIMDVSTGSPVAGANISIRNGAQLLASAASATDGRYRLVFQFPNQSTPQNLKLAVHRDKFLDATGDVVVVAGHTDSPAYPFSLVPVAIADCRANRNHAVVVGYFRPPASAAADPELADRIKDTLDYDLLVRIQQARVHIDAQPIVVACDGAKPPATADIASFAKALQADAFISGYVAPGANPASQKVKVEMSIADRFGLLVPAVRASSPNIDLDDPAAARLNPDAHRAIFTALIAGYEKAGQPADCVEVVNAAEKMLGSLTQAMADARARCQKALPNHGLLPGGSP